MARGGMNYKASHDRRIMERGARDEARLGKALREARVGDRMTLAQRSYIKTLARERGVDIDTATIKSKEEAHEMIQYLKPLPVVDA